MSNAEFAGAGISDGAFSDQAFLQDFATMSSHGATAAGGVDREACTPADQENRQWMSTVFERATGAPTQFDAIANQFSTIEFIPGAPYVLLGSHLDSQPMAGRFDGAYGVLAGAYAVGRVRAAVEAGEITPKFNLAVVNWFNEEGSRFAPSMMGSSVAVNKMGLDEALESTDFYGTTVREAFDETGYPGDAHLPEIASYAEIHNEQGKNLEQAGAQIGLVTATWGARKFRVVVRGEQGHTGSTLMEDRHDALFGASIVIAQARRIVDKFPGQPLQISVSQMEVKPNSPVTIAREVIFNVDIRCPHAEILDQAEQHLETVIAEAADEARVKIERTLTHSWNQNDYSPAGCELAREVAEELGYSHRKVMTVAGHDSTNMKDEVPTVMLFVPSVDGISHNEAELTLDDDCLAGLDVFTGVVRCLVAGALHE